MKTDNIDRIIKAGSKDRHWYRDCEQVFVDLFGRDQLELVSTLFAATSINTSLKSNITLFRRSMYEMANNLPTGPGLPVMRVNIDRAKKGEPLWGRKIRAFAGAMSGDADAVVVDIWLLRAFGMDQKYYRKDPKGKARGLYRSSGATDKAYTQIESYVRDEAAKRGLEARELSAIIWSGARTIANGRDESHYKQILTNLLTNLFNVL